MTYLASSAKAKTPAASGAAAEVPEWVFVHLPYKSVVAYYITHSFQQSIQFESIQMSYKQIYVN